MVLPWLRQSHIDNPIAYLCSLALQSVHQGLSPEPLFKLIQGQINDKDIQINNVCVIILAELFDKSTFNHLDSIVDLVLEIISKTTVTSLPLGIFVSSLLQLMSHPSKLTTSMAVKGVKLIEVYYKQRQDDHQQEQLEQLEHYEFGFDYNVAKAIRINNLSLDNSLKFMETQTEHFGLTASMFLLHDSPYIINKCLESFKILINKDKCSCPRVVTLIMHKLSVLPKKSKGQKIYESQFKMLKMLPTLAQDKACVALVLSLINSLKVKKGLTSLRLRLLYDLWKVEPRCYLHLQRGLEEDFQAVNERQRLDYLMAKASIIRNICKDKADSYGADLLKPLSEMLNDSQNGVLVATLAMEGITLLCKEGVIDIMTTVKVLAPKFKIETRIPVAKKFFKLLAVAATFQNEAEEFMMFIMSTLTLMWKKAADSNVNRYTSCPIYAYAKVEIFR
jgi:hypothetical protein